MRSEKLKTLRYKLILFSLTLFTVHCSLFTDVHALDINKKILPSGLTVLHSEKHNLPIVMATMIVKASLLDEPKKKAGLAYLTAELLDEGTKNRKSSEISEEIEFIGAGLGASAGGDYTTITLSVLKKDIEKGFELLSDIILNPVFPQEELDRKREMTKGSLKQREDDPSFLAERSFKKEVFGEHPYGRLVEGSTETLSEITREDLREIHSKYFIPNNAILSVVGDLTPSELDSLIKKYLDPWKIADLPERKIHPMNEEKTKKAVKMDKDVTQATIIIGHLGISRNNPDYYAVSVMNYILGSGGFASRLMQKIRDELGLAYDVRSFFDASKEKGSFQAEVQTKNESANTAIEEILKQIEKIRNEQVSDEELSGAKDYLIGSFPRRLDTSRKIADFLATVEFYNLGLDYAEKYASYINAVTKEDVQRVAGKYLDAENFILIVVANQKKAALKY
ncbi:MAG: pitrilysin family protein [Thermodesulfovibrionales bacterium]|nr:pitrilysin family protein [Thermodesulfovibrionales bacterium]